MINGAALSVAAAVAVLALAGPPVLAWWLRLLGVIDADRRNELAVATWTTAAMAVPLLVLGIVAAPTAVGSLHDALPGLGAGVAGLGATGVSALTWWERERTRPAPAADDTPPPTTPDKEQP